MRKIRFNIPFNWTIRHSCGENLETMNRTMLTPTYANITHIYIINIYQQNKNYTLNPRLKLCENY